MANCVACGETVPASARFCPSCGTARAAACPACGAAAIGRFCAECGTAIASTTVEPAPPVAAPAPVTRTAERRITSVLFGDLVGFTTLSESRDPDDVRELLSQYFSVCRTIVERYGGQVEKFIGDAVMAVWGVPVAHEDDAERAVRAGMELTDAVAVLGEDAGVPGLSMRVGVVTGEVAVNVGATGEGMVAGDAVNTAARVQTAAAPGKLWVDDQTRELTAAAVTYDDRGPHELKGKAEPVRLFEARQVVAAVGGARRVDGLEAPFSGRDRELRLVKELFHATLEEGRPRLVAVFGAAGVGKSRLGWEFDKYSDGINDLVAVHRGRCLSYGEGVAFWALAEVVRGRLRILEGDPNHVVVERLREGLDTYVPDADDRSWLLPRMATLLGVVELVAAGSSFVRDDLFAAWRTFLEHVSRANDGVGAMVQIDDLQWADPGLLDFINHVLDNAQAPIFMLTLARPELTERAPGFGSGRRSTPIYLEPLADSSMATLVDGLVHGLPPSLRDALVERSEGIPLFAVETVRALIDRDAVIPSEGRYVLAPDGAERIDLADQSLPTSLQTLIASRLDALPADERRVVQDAAVLGHSFSGAGLAMVMEAVGDTADVREALASLVRKEIFSIESDPRSSEQGQHRFVQAMVRTVAYDTLSRRDRKARHLAAARYLADEPDADAIVAVIASHYLDAHLAAAQDDDATELAGRAVELLERAAAQARAVSAPAEARRHLESALSLVSEPAVIGRLTESAARAALAAGVTSDAGALAQRAQAAYREADMPVDAGRALAVWGEAQIHIGHAQSVIEPLTAAYEELAGRDDAAEATAALALGVARGHYMSAGQNSQALVWFDRAVALGEVLNDLPLLATTLASYAGALIIAGRAHMGIGLLQVSLDLARRTDNPTLQLRPLNNLISFLAARDLPAAREYSESGIAIVRRIGDQDWGLYVLSSAVHVYWNAGDWDEALRAVDMVAEAPEFTASPVAVVASSYQAAISDARGLDTAFPEIDDSPTGQHHDVVAGAASNLLSAARARRAGDIATAAAMSHAAFESYVEGSGIDDDFDLYWTLAVDDQIAVGDFDVARDLLKPVVKAPTGLVPVLQAALLPALRARVAAAAQEQAGVEEDFRLAATRLRQFGAPYFLARTLLDHAEWLDRNGDVAGAMPLAAEALEVFTGLGAVPWVERAARLAGGAHSGRTSATVIASLG